MRFRGLFALLLASALGAATANARAEDPVPASPEPAPKTSREKTDRNVKSVLPGDITLSAEKFSYPTPGTMEASGAVTIETADSRIQADRLTLRDNRYVEADGNVLVVFGANRLSGTHISYDLKEEVGYVENAMGQIEEADLFYQADKVDKVGPDRLVLTDATVSTCTQPTPYWSFRVSSARIRLNHYARMRNLRLQVGGVPVFYLPWMAWPVKRDRAVGLLIPRIGSSATRGRILGEDLFIPMGRSADLKLGAEYYSLAGLGYAAEFRAIPNRDGEVRGLGFYIDDKVSGFPRWSLLVRQTQRFLNGFRMVTDFTRISDFNFFSDYARDLTLVSSPQVLARVEFSRNGSWTSLNVRELRRDQLFADGTTLTQQALPQIEFLGRSRKLGKTPLYLSFDSSFGALLQKSRLIDADYLRFDASPTISAPFSPAPWFDINPSVNFRSTYYTQHQEPQTLPGAPVTIVDSPLARNVAGASLEFVGPKLFRIFQKKDDPKAPRYKSTIETRLAYAFQQGFDRSAEIIPYDAVDLFIGDINQVVYGVRTKLIAQRVQSKPADDATQGERVLVPEGTGDKVREAAPDVLGQTVPEAAGPPPPREPVEIFSFNIQQRYAFDRYLSFADLDRNLSNEATSKFSDIEAIARYSPDANANVDFRSTWQPLYKKISGVSVSGGYRNSWFRTQLSILHTPGLGVVQVYDPINAGLVLQSARDVTQVRYYGGITVWNGKVVLDADGSFNPTPATGEARFPDLRLRFQYYTQCCGFLAEYLERDFTTIQRRDFRIAVDLRGIGKLFEFAGSQ